MARARRSLGIAAVAAAMLWAAAGAAARDDELNRRKLAALRHEALVEAGTRHAKVGVWCRDAGLVAQASAEFLRAVEVSEGENPWAQRILALMRNLDDAFWKKKLKKPSGGMLRGYEKRARQAHEQFQKDRLRLARWADAKGLEDEALEEYKAVVRLSDDYVKVDDKGLVVLDVGKIPQPYSERLLRDAVTINGKPRVRDAFLEKLPQVKEVFEASNDDLIVRSQSGEAQAAAYLTMCAALLPHLEADMGGKPTRRLRMFLFKERATYEAYCDAAGLSSHKAATGLADGGAFVTLVCAEGLDDASVRGVALHELTHLFQYGVTPTVMPSWYNEGFAETYGGDGTFTWDGEALAVGGPMSASLIQPLRDPKTYIPLARLLESDALTLINENRTSARVFYNEAWAFFRYLRTAAGNEIGERFARYELVCRGAALGAKAGEHHNRDATDAATYFKTLFGPDLPAIEQRFQAWLAAYEAPVAPR